MTLLERIRAEIDRQERLVAHLLVVKIRHDERKIARPETTGDPEEDLWVLVDYAIDCQRYKDISIRYQREIDVRMETITSLLQLAGVSDEETRGGDQGGNPIDHAPAPGSTA